MLCNFTGFCQVFTKVENSIVCVHDNSLHSKWCKINTKICMPIQQLVFLKTNKINVYGMFHQIPIMKDHTIMHCLKHARKISVLKTLYFLQNWFLRILPLFLLGSLVMVSKSYTCTMTVFSLSLSGFQGKNMATTSRSCPTYCNKTTLQQSNGTGQPKRGEQQGQHLLSAHFN